MLADQCWWSTFILSVGGISVNSTRVPGWLPQHFMYMYPNSWSLVNITWMWQQREVSWLTFRHFTNPIPNYGRSARKWDWHTKWYELILYCVIVSSILLFIDQIWFAGCLFLAVTFWTLLLVRVYETSCIILLHFRILPYNLTMRYQYMQTQNLVYYGFLRLHYCVFNMCFLSISVSTPASKVNQVWDPGCETTSCKN